MRNKKKARKAFLYHRIEKETQTLTGKEYVRLKLDNWWRRRTPFRTGETYKRLFSRTGTTIKRKSTSAFKQHEISTIMSTAKTIILATFFTTNNPFN